MTWSDDIFPPDNAEPSVPEGQGTAGEQPAPLELPCPVCDRLIPPPAPEFCPHCQAPIHTILKLLKTADLSLREAMRDISIGQLDSAEQRLEFVSATSKRYRLKVEIIRALIERLRGNPQAALARIKAVESRIEDVDEDLIDLLEETERHALEDQYALATCCENYNFALFQAKKGHFEEARRWLVKALDLVPHHADCHALLGKVQLALDEYDDARYHLRRALATEPTNASASRTLAKLSGSGTPDPLRIIGKKLAMSPSVFGSTLVIIILVIIALAALLSK
jgi:tetratricopeptide (TPR) repeat protein